MKTSIANRRRALVAGSGLLLALVAGSVSSALAFDPGSEQANFSKHSERSRYDFSSSEFQAKLQQRFVDNIGEELKIQTTDPERNYEGNICSHRSQECAGDVRFYDWGEQRPRHHARRVLFTARSGAVHLGHGVGNAQRPAKRPGIVITTGSVQAPETLYWGIAATLAKHGYVVLTYDVQGQGRSDTLGEGADRTRACPRSRASRSTTAPRTRSTSSSRRRPTPYRPRPSCTTGTDHARQAGPPRRGGLATPRYNPLWDLLDPHRIGIAGHSLGARRVSFVGQLDPRVDAIVAWDNLRPPTQRRTSATPTAPRTRDRTPLPITKPALGFSNDYGLSPSRTPGPRSESQDAAFAAYGRRAWTRAARSSAAAPTTSTRCIPNTGFGATLRGMDLAAWYTAAWFDKYVKGDPTPTARLLTTAGGTTRAARSRPDRRRQPVLVLPRSRTTS